MFKSGSIKKIQVKNFVTHSYVEMYPGPNLNMIIGPNGTGKSTIVGAIILGLGGNPKIVGRGTKISEYVKHDCQEATINIYLQDDKENQHIKITRQFDIHNKSNWRINDRKSSETEVSTCVQKFNIQVNNLCQFLPQDKVQDFAKLNKQDLLKHTQIALCRQDLIEKQESLIRSRENHKDMLSSTAQLEKKLQEAQDANVRLEGRVENFNKKMKFKEKITHIERKMAWTAYEDVRAKLTEIKADKKKAQEVFDKYKHEAKPMEKEINDARSKISEMQQKNSRLMQTIKNAEASVNNSTEKLDAVKEKISNIEYEVNSKIAEIEQRETEIENSVKKLEEMRELQRQIVAKCSEADKERQAMTNEINKFTSHLRTLQEKKYEVEQALQEGTSEIRALENEQRRIENVKQQRFEYLRRINEDAYNGVLWLRNNKHLFKNEIFEPIMLEVNVLENNKSAYVENCIPMRDRLAFTCVDKNDMNLLIKCLRQQQGLSVNILHSGNDGRGSSHFQPDIPIEQLRKYGFYTYINTLFTAPEPIMRYLCNNYRLHNIPVGDASVNENYERLPQKIRSFFSDKYRFSISFSKYSGEKSTRQTEFRGDGGLSLTLDIIRLENLRGRINEIKINNGNYSDQVENYNSQINKISDKIIEFRDKMKEMQQQRQQVQAIESRINAAQRTLNEMRQKKMNPEDIHREAKQKISNHIRNMRNVQEVMKNDMDNFIQLITQSKLNSLEMGNRHQKLTYLENKITDLKQKCRDAEETLNAISDKYVSIMHEAKTELARAKNLSNGFTPADDGFNEFRGVFDSLSGDVQKLNAEKEVLLSRIACLNTADDGEIREYEDRLKQIEKLEVDIKRTNNELGRITTTMDRMQEEWLGPLRQLVTEINQKFSAGFERMGCAGEISVCEGDNDKDFAQYGLSIKVTYRSGEPLQELNSTVQSGGERAVATAAFMLSLQELTPVPFRCVDEINQGMDANNERRIFEMIIDCTSQPNTPQYFLVTPKLVPHLRYSRQLVIHTVHNGPFVPQDRKWGFSKLCNPHDIQIH